MDISKALRIPGWMTEGELNWLAEAASKSTNIVEIGSWRGRSARAMADNTYGTIFAVDTWDDAAVGFPGWWTASESAVKKPDWLWHAFRSNLYEYIGTTVIPFRMNSVNAAEAMKYNMLQFDMIFIDADHTFAGVQQDILSWRPLLRPGGILCGHDFGHPQCPDVVPAVTQLIPNVKVFETIWRAE